MAVDDVIQLRIVGRYQQQNIVNTLHYQVTAQTTSDLDLLAGFITAWGDIHEIAFLACHIDTYELIGYKAFRVDGTAKTPAYENRGMNGTVVGDEVPSNVCRTVTLYTASENHRRRGRLMLSGSEAAMFNITDGSVTVAAVAILQTLGDLLTTTLEPGVDSYQLVLPAAGANPIIDITAAIGRVTPSAIKSRRVSQYLIG